NLTSVGLLFINANAGAPGSITLAPNVMINVHGGCALCFGNLPSAGRNGAYAGQPFAFFPIALLANSINFDDNSSIVSDATSGYGIGLGGLSSAPTQITLQGSTATLQTSGGKIFIGPMTVNGPPGPFAFPVADSSLTFSTTSAGGSTLNL